MTERPAFESLIQELSQHSLLAVDFEGEWNLHRYGLHLCLIQVSDGVHNWLIDPLTVGDLRPFLDLMENPEIRIISHGPQSDIILMDYRFGCNPRNVFDTEKAAQILGYENTSLSALLEVKFGISKNTKVRASNWNLRPLTDKMMAYAAQDVAWLHDLYEMLTAELTAKDRLHWQEEENRLLEAIRYRKKETPWLELPGANKLGPRQVMILREIYELREKIAGSLDRPSYHILPNPKLLELALDPPGHPRAWMDMKGANPKLRFYAQEFHDAVTKALTAPLETPVETPAARLPAFARMSKKTYFKRVDQRMTALEALQKWVESQYDVSRLILSGRIIKRIAYGEGSFFELRAWQQEILQRGLAHLNIDPKILGDE